LLQTDVLPTAVRYDRISLAAAESTTSSVEVILMDYLDILALSVGFGIGTVWYWATKKGRRWLASSLPSYSCT